MNGATWKPGQRDEWHSHPANTVVYAQNDRFDAAQTIDSSP